VTTEHPDALYPVLYRERFGVTPPPLPPRDDEDTDDA